MSQSTHLGLDAIFLLAQLAWEHAPDVSFRRPAHSPESQFTTKNVKKACCCHRQHEFSLLANPAQRLRTDATSNLWHYSFTISLNSKCTSHPYWLVNPLKEIQCEASDSTQLRSKHASTRNLATTGSTTWPSINLASHQPYMPCRCTSGNTHMSISMGQSPHQSPARPGSCLSPAPRTPPAGA